MTTSLGQAVANLGIMHCKNKEGATILKGTACSLVIAAAMPTGDPQLYVADFGTVPPTNPPILEIEKTDTNAKFLGVALEDIKDDLTGRICVYGPVLALTGTDIVFLEAIQVDTDGSFKDWATGDKHGVALADGVAGPALSWIFVTPAPGLGAV